MIIPRSRQGTQLLLGKNHRQMLSSATLEWLGWMMVHWLIQVGSSETVKDSLYITLVRLLLTPPPKENQTLKFALGCSSNGWLSPQENPFWSLIGQSSTIPAEPAKFPGALYPDTEDFGPSTLLWEVDDLSCLGSEEQSCQCNRRKRNLWYSYSVLCCFWRSSLAPTDDPRRCKVCLTPLHLKVTGSCLSWPVYGPLWFSQYLLVFFSLLSFGCFLPCSGCFLLFFL